MAISDWSTTASSNATADSASGISWPEGMNPGQVNDSARAMMAVIKTDWDGHNIPDLKTAWTSTSVGVSSGTGTLGTATCTRRHKKIGRLVFIQLDLTITAVGTGGGSIQITLPNTAAAFFMMTGRETGVTGKMIQGFVSGSTSTLNMLYYDNTSPAANGSRIVLSGVYEATS